MKPIAIFYHSLLFYGNPPEFSEQAFAIVTEQMSLLKRSGLENAATEIIIGINDGGDSKEIAQWLFPRLSKKVFHGLQSRAENLTIVEIEKWAPTHPNWNVLYFHSKGATHSADSAYGNNVSAPWRRAMMNHLVANWRQCVTDLESVESVGCHFMRNLADGTQNIWAGNFFWCNSNFLATLPSIYERDRIKVSGIASAESRFEAEVWIGNGKRCPTVKEYLPAGGEGVP